MKKIASLFYLLFCVTANAQLAVDNTSQTPKQLVQNVVVGQGVSVSNIKFNGTAANADLVSDQVGLFSNGLTTNIGLNTGIILSTGNAIISKGPNDNAAGTLPTANPFIGDPDLYILSNNQSIQNVAILEFDFVPTGNKLSFNFVFASEEYPEFVNDTYNDNFGFFLSGPGITGPFNGGAKNIALIPTTTLPVSINNLNNGTSNTGPCEYCQYYVNNEGGASIQYDGFTKVLAANADVICGQTYHIKLAIANVGDNNYDSAVFIEGASFSSPTINLGPDLKICSASDHVLNSGLNASEIHEWKYNGTVIPGEIGPQITVNQSGLYTVQAFPFGATCPVNDEINIQFSTLAAPYLYCGAKTANSITFDWLALGTATFSVAYKIGNNPLVDVGYLGSVYTYTVPNVPTGETVVMTVTPIGTPAECFGPNSISCVLDTCAVTPSLTVTQGPTSQQICENTAISDIIFKMDGGATNASLTSGNLPAGLTTSLVGDQFTISGTATATGTFNYTISTSGGCATNANTSGTITVNPKTIPLFTPLSSICEGETLAALPLLSNNGISGIWSPTLSNTSTTEYTFTPNAGQCASSTKLTVTVNSVVTPTFTSIAPICDGETLAALPLKSNNNINGTWSPALNNVTTTEYTFSPNVGQCANSTKLTITVIPKITPTFNAVPSICEGETLAPLPLQSNNSITGTWSPALNNSTTTEYTFSPTVGQCANSAKLTIIVNLGTVPIFTAVAPICEGETLAPLPLQSNNSITGTWSPALNNATTTEYTFTPNSGQCANLAKLTITVNPIVTPTFATIAPICEGETLAPLPLQSNNSITGTWSPPLNNATTTEYTFTPNSGQCANLAKLTITVNPIVTPTFASIAAICEGEILTPLPLQSKNNITGTWSPALNNSTTTEYTFSPTVGQCANSTKLTITIIPKTRPIFNAVSPICEGETLTPLPLQSNNGITGTWSPVLNNSTTTEYTFTPNSGECANKSKLTISVFSKPAPLLTDGNICVDKKSNAVIQSYLLDTKLEQSTHDFEWFLNGQKIYNAIENTFEASQKGSYSVLVTNKITNCKSNAIIAIVNETISNTSSFEIRQTNAFSENTILTISNIDGTGTYEYQLDQGPFQQSNIFPEVSSGAHALRVVETNGCTDLSYQVIVIGFPKFFTPNGDGHNDTWNIMGLSSKYNPAIYIFDRYGKFLKQINSIETGWDGNFNGQPMPATDYWFKIIYLEDGINKEFKSHFSLKR